MVFDVRREAPGLAMRATLLAVASLGAVHVGCADTRRSEPGDDDAGDAPLDAGQGADAGPAVDAAPMHTDGSAPDAGLPDAGSADTGSPDAGSSDAGPVVADAGPAAGDSRLFPIELGRVWSYALIEGTCASLPSTEVFAVAPGSDGDRLVTMRSACAGTYGFRQLASGSLYYEEGLYHELLLVDPPDEDLVWHTWDVQSEMVPVASITVPAGTFEGCWRVRAAQDTTTYCPGVGPVRVEYIGVAVMELTGTNF